MPSTSRYIAPDGTRIWHRLQGQGPAVVLCDGVGCDGYIWPYVMDRFEHDLAFLRWHYRGHGNSDEPRDLSTLTIDDSVRDLRGVLQEREGAGELSLPVVLVGHSMGCQIILEYALRHPEDVKALVLICGSAGRPLDTFGQASGASAVRGAPMRALIGRLIKEVDKRPDFVNVLWSSVFSSPLVWPLAARTEVNLELIRKVDFMPYLRHMGRIKAATFLRMLSYAAEHSTWERLEDVKPPTLVVAARHDRFTPMHLSEEMAERIPEAELALLPEGTHTAPLEMPELLNTFLQSFFESQGLSISPEPQA